MKSLCRLAHVENFPHEKTTLCIIKKKISFIKELALENNDLRKINYKRVSLKKIVFKKGKNN
jgi:hypothetical protein